MYVDIVHHLGPGTVVEGVGYLTSNHTSSSSRDPLQRINDGKNRNVTRRREADHLVAR